jgi:hypothetical protein
MKLASQRDAAKHSTAAHTSTALRAGDDASSADSLATARKPTAATDATCKAASAALMALSAALQLAHCATCDQYLSMSLSLVAVVGGSWPGCGVAQPTWFLPCFLNQFLKATTMTSDGAGT